MHCDICTLIESCTQFENLELVENVLCTVIWILDPLHVLQYRVHSTYSTNSKVLDGVHDSIAVECVLSTGIHVL